jgi:glutathione peroxidase
VNERSRTMDILLASLPLAITGGIAGAAEAPAQAPTVQAAAASADTTETDHVLDLTMNRIDGTPEHLSEVYAGKIVLVVNTASRCGLTPQYEALEELYQDKKGDGLVILGFPANDFMNQEPGTNDEIAAFCSQNYGVTFPMFEKIAVKGDGQHELFKRLTEATDEPTWNFTKYLIDREGNVVRRFDPRTAPGNDKLVAEIDELLEKASDES